jgi:Phage gp6-like head-tail connector protein
MAFGDLTNLADVKAWLQVGQNPFPDTDDLLLSRLITAASGFIESWLGRQIASADWLEMRDGSGGQLLAFANFPVSSVLSLSIDGIDIPPAPDDGGFGAGYSFTPTELALRGYVFTRRAQNVIVTYTAGYAATPPDISQACIELVCQRYRERSRIGEMSKALSTGETIRYSQQDMSEDIKTLLSQYRAAAPVSGFARRLASTDTDPALIGAAI